MQPLQSQLIKIPFLDFVEVTPKMTVPSIIQKIAEKTKYEFEKIRLIFEVTSRLTVQNVIVLNPTSIELTDEQGPLLDVKLDGAPINYSKGHIFFRFKYKCMCDKCNGVAAKTFPFIKETSGGKDLFVAGSAAGLATTLVNG